MVTSSTGLRSRGVCRPFLRGLRDRLGANGNGLPRLEWPGRGLGQTADETVQRPKAVNKTVD